jgi:hypothetical protein
MGARESREQLPGLSDPLRLYNTALTDKSLGNALKGMFYKKTSQRQSQEKEAPS